MQKKIIVRWPTRDSVDTLSDSPILDRVFKNRGVACAEQVNYKLTTLAAPQQLMGLQEAVNLLHTGLKENWRICIVGDFDADGATSTALAMRALKQMGCANVSYLVPNRFEYGYGLTPEIVAVVARQQPDLIITVDNGISSIEGVASARNRGIKVLVTDHHLPGKQLPQADAIVNPNQFGCAFPSKNLAGVGVIFYVMSALRRQLIESAWFTQHHLPVPNMANFLDLVALGTVADVVPLDYNNRILVAQGLQRIRAGKCVAGINALFSVANRNRQNLVATDLGFAIGPRLNAAGRLDDMALGIRCLLADDENEALDLARELDDLNRDRRLIETSMQVEAVKILDALVPGQGDAWPMGVCLYKQDWHQGVIGILASRVKDRLHRPTIVFARTDDGELKGSGRSVAGIHLRDVLDEVATQHPGLLQKFGGHAMAAGLSLKLENLDAFQQAFDQCVQQHLGDAQLQAQLMSDGELRESDFQLNLAQTIRAGGPWGQAFPEPIFDGKFRILQQRLVGAKHLKMLVTPGEYSGLALDAIAFNVDLNLWPNPDIQYAQFAYKLDINEYRGNTTLQLMVEYLEPCEFDAGGV